jgi:tetratricopeptide (TPR) repeat protein
MQDADSYLEHAKLLIDRNQWMPAEAEVRQALALAPERTDALSLLGMCIAFNGDVPAGIELVEQAIEIEPDRALSYLQLYKVYWWAWKWVDAKQAIEKAIELDPENPDYYGRLGLFFHYIAIFRKIKNYAGDNILPKLGLDNRDIDLNDSEENIDRSLFKLSKKTAEIGLSYNPLNELCLECKTDSLVGLEQYVEAEISCNILMSLDPNSASAHRTLGEIYYAQNRWDESAISFLTALEIQPNDNDYIKSKTLSALKAKYLFRQKFTQQHQWLINRANESEIYASTLATVITIFTLIWFTPFSIGMSLLLWMPLLILWLMDDLPSLKLLNQSRYGHLFSQEQINDLSKRTKFIIIAMIIFIARALIPWNPTIINLPFK